METPSRTRGRPVGLGSGLCSNRDRGPLASLPRPKCPRSYRVGAPRSMSTFRDRPLFQMSPSSDVCPFRHDLGVERPVTDLVEKHRAPVETVRRPHVLATAPVKFTVVRRTCPAPSPHRWLHRRPQNRPAARGALEGRAHYFGSTAGVRPYVPSVICGIGSDAVAGHRQSSRGSLPWTLLPPRPEALPPRREVAQILNECRLAARAHRKWQDQRVVAAAAPVMTSLVGHLGELRRTRAPQILRLVGSDPPGRPRAPHTPSDTPCRACWAPGERASGIPGSGLMSGHWPLGFGNATALDPAARLPRPRPLRSSVIGSRRLTGG